MGKFIYKYDINKYLDKVYKRVLELYPWANMDIIKEEYEIEKIDIFTGKLVPDCLFTITDEELLNKTGGVVQGMSGSPIIQNGKLIGAVTHAIVDDCKKGYGIFITNMLEEADN